MNSNHQQKPSNFDKVEAHVEQIHVFGLKRTKDDIFKKHILPVFEAKNLLDILKEIAIANHKYKLLGLFKNSKATIDINPISSKAYNVNYQVKETKLICGGINTTIGTNDGSVSASLKLVNLFGRGEGASHEMTYGSKNLLGYKISLLKPLLMNPELPLRLSLFMLTSDYPQSLFKETVRGISLDYSFSSKLSSHILKWEGVWRELEPISQLTAFCIREEAGHSLKSSLKHVWKKDMRDSKTLPKNGFFIQLSQEITGFGGDVKFLKHETELQHNFPLPFDSTIQLSFGAGLMYPFSQDLRNISILDRFFLGGPLTLRGFNVKGIGPRINECSLGGCFFWCGGIHLYTPLPFKQAKKSFGDILKTHFFINSGCLNNCYSSCIWQKKLQILSSNCRVSTGLGLVLKLGETARLEFNYCFPLKAQANDSINPGLQFGIGVSFF